MKQLLSRAAGAAVVVFALATSTGAGASEVEHYEGKKPESLEEAVALFAQYNAKLEAILAKDSLSDADMQKVHELSYTIENALGMINQEMLSLAETLEKVHKASERRDAETVSPEGEKFIGTSKTITGRQ
jgi:hypothetical protein